MKIILLLSLLYIMTNCGPAPITNKTPEFDDNEKRIIAILDTLKNDYYWQMVPTDLMGRIPTQFDFERERKEFPFRAERDAYLQELDSLMYKDLSENFTIGLLNKNVTEYILSKVIDKLFTYQSDDAYAALFHFYIANPGHSNIAVMLVENGQYKDDIRALVFQMVNDEHITYLASFFHLFDPHTDKQFCSKIIEYINSQIEVDTEKAYQAGLLIAHGYFRMHYEYFENEETRALIEEYHQCKTTEDEDKIRNKYNRAWIKNLLQYYKIHENE